MKQMCKYALVQFMPFVETGEFANVGVVLCAPNKNYWEFKLAPQRFKRLTDFFNEMDKEVYKVAVMRFEEEMAVTKAFAEQQKMAKDLVSFFTEVTRPRQALLRFSHVRTLLTDNPETELAALYETFIHRDFVTKKYKEQLMGAALRKQINHKNLAYKYKEKKLKANVREVTIPLAADTNDGLRLIKPLAFRQTRATQLFEHGETWYNRIYSLIEDGVVEVDNVLLPIDMAKAIKGEKREALEAVKELFKRKGINLVNYAEREKIVDFAGAIRH